MFQILTNVQKENQVVMLMLSVLTPMGHISALVNLDIMETERIVKVRIFLVLRIQEKEISIVERYKLF